MSTTAPPPLPTEPYTTTRTPYPAKTRTQTASISSVPTTATATYFSDKILITISQDGRLAHWLHVPLDISPTDSSLTSPYTSHDNETSSDLLPMHHLTATTVLGGTMAGLDVLGQTLATQVASAILVRDPGERRMVVLGLGLGRGFVEGEGAREAFGEVVGLALGVL
ncbi:hypothetical protein BU24DRAFT_175477 [Aaosphaeria arxii CBS 175.79]|uniref:Proteasome assembly chaperone 3 n=1 Tax=Aaosphaeria arxii CBS 175.79 TaxID=1450172 RepID=A0A6A5XQ11_9PLEO|nr:uncharacterized protein BU24DRAFT_175477 [Aaosphaeria arxii CBS 175.79]KAF2015338.1 hypothetical protein BU24DRAFT_175477 [Aaosphaeria arxii CBS 175.79]